MSTFRTNKRDLPFVQIDKELLSNEGISWKAKGILTYLLSKPNDWITYISDLEKQSTDGRDSVRNGIKELLTAGYMKRNRSRDECGKFAGFDYDVFEKPCYNSDFTKDGKTDFGKTDVGKTDFGKSNTTNNDLSNNDLSNKNKKKANPFVYYETHGFGLLNPTTGEYIGKWVDEFKEGESIVIKAMEEAVRNNAVRWKYVDAILKDWNNRNLQTIHEVEIYINDRNNPRKSNKGNSLDKLKGEWGL